MALPFWVQPTVSLKFPPVYGKGLEVESFQRPLGPTSQFATAPFKVWVWMGLGLPVIRLSWNTCTFVVTEGLASLCRRVPSNTAPSTIMALKESMQVPHLFTTTSLPPTVRGYSWQGAVYLIMSSAKI